MDEQYKVGPDGDTLIPLSPNSKPLKLSELAARGIKPQYVAESENQEKYGSLGQQALTGLESALSGGTLGFSDVAEVQSGLATPEDISGRREANPITSFLGTGAGGAALMTATGGLGGLAPGVESALGGGALAHIAGTALEGSIFGAGNAVSEAALGDPSLNAQKVLTDIGLGAALGGGLGALSKALGALPNALKREGKVPAGLETPSMQPSSIGSLDDMKRMVDSSPAEFTHLPQASALQEATFNVGHELQFPVTEAQKLATQDTEAQRLYKTLSALPGEDGKIIRNYESLQKAELSKKIDESIGQISHGYDLTDNRIEAGERAAERFTQAIEGIREELSPTFEKLKNTELSEVDHLPGALEYLTSAAKPHGDPNLARMFDTAGDTIEFKPYNSQMGIADKTYSRVKSLINDLKTNPTNFQGLKNAREALTDGVNLLEDSRASKQLTQAKAALMDYMQDKVQEVVPDVNVRDLFKRWAINEQNAQSIERKFGAEIGTDNFRSLARGQADEAILRKIFRDSETVSLAKSVLRPEEFNRTLADYVNLLKTEATKDNAFSSNKFGTALEKAKYPLQVAFEENPGQLQRIQDFNTIARLNPDRAPINPSGTAVTWFQGVLSTGYHPADLARSVWNVFQKGYQDSLKRKQMNAMLSGNAEEALKIKGIGGILESVQNQIKKATQAIFNEYTYGPIRGGVTAAILSEKKMQDLSQHLENYATHPESLMNDMADNSQHLFQAAPQITAGIHQTIARGVNFLYHKLPQNPNTTPLAAPFKATYPQRAQFSKYYQAVNNPLGILKQVQHGALDQGSLQACQEVHPDLMNHLRQEVLSHLDLEKARKMPYQNRKALSLFLGQPLDENMKLSAAMNQQAVAQLPSLSRQTSEAAKVRLGGAKNMKIADRTSTQTRRDLDRD